MSRPVEIDRDKAFRKAYRLFWEKGYQAASLQQLLDVMQIGRSSFYAAFGSKEALFRDVIRTYRRQAAERFERLKAKQPGLAVIQSFIDETLIDISDRNRRLGCLAVNGVLELAGIEPELHQEAVEMLEDLRRMIEEQLIEAEKLGEISSNTSPQELSQLMLTMLQGMRVASRSGMSREQAQAASDAMFGLMNPA